MSDALENAAIAFDQSMGVPAPQPSRRGNSESTATESMFDNLGDLEVDEESPPQGGGDDEPVKSQRPVEDEDEVDPDTIEDEDEVDPKAKKADDEEDADDDEAEDPVYEVIVDGQPAEVKLSEALAGYIRTETFHQRLNLLENVKQQLGAEAAKVAEDRRTYSEKIAEIEKHLEMVIPPEPDWIAEYKRDPEAAAALQQRYKQLNGIRANLAAEKAKTSKEQQEADIAAYKEWAAQEDAKIMRNNPRWADENVAKQDLQMMMQTGLALGFAKEELLSVRDSRMVGVLLKAAKYDRIMARNPKPVRKGKATPVNSGAVNPRSAPKGGNKAMKNLQRTGSVEAAGDFFTNLIQGRK